MLQVNLLPWRASERQRRKRLLLYQAVTLLALLLLAMLAWRWLVQREVTEQSHTTQHWTALQMRLDAQLKKVDEASLQLQSLQQAVSQRQQRYMKSVAYLHLLRALSRHIPDGVWLTQLTEEVDGLLRLRGESVTYHSAMAFTQALKEEGSLADIHLVDMQRQPNHHLQFLMQLRLAVTHRD